MATSDETPLKIFLAAHYTLVGAAFVGSWAYCIVKYGYLIGVGLGWLPSLIVAYLAYVLLFVAFLGAAFVGDLFGKGYARLNALVTYVLSEYGRVIVVLIGICLLYALLFVQ